jgi:hypothetical protein
MRKENVNYVDENLKQTNIKKQDFVVGVVLQNITEIKTRQCNVYDIEVEDEHEYFAN